MIHSKTDQALALLAANPQAAADFDRATAGRFANRRDAVISTLEAIDAKIAEAASLRSQLDAKKQRITALDRAKVLNGRLKAQLAVAKARPRPAPAAPAKAATQATAKPARRWMRATPTKAAPQPIPEPIPAGPLTRAQFNALSPRDRMAYIKGGGKISS